MIRVRMLAVRGSGYWVVVRSGVNVTIGFSSCAGCTRLHGHSTLNTGTTGPTPTAKAATIQTQRLRIEIFSSGHALPRQSLAIGN